MNESHPNYIVVEGPIGVGKTTLAKRLAATYNSDLMLELVQENPFLSRFYADPKTNALPTQLFFLFQRAKQVEELWQEDMFKPKGRVADFFMEKDKLFAEVTLSNDELDLYRQIYDRLTLDAPMPDLVIYLQAPADTLLQRVVERGNNYETKIQYDYLRRIADAYIEFFYHYSESPLLIVNTEDFDLSEDKNYQLLLEYVNEPRPGKHYLNLV